MTTEERDAIIRRELDIYDQLDEIESALYKARIALGNLTDEVCQMRRNTETHDICTNTHECVKDTHDKTEPQIYGNEHNCIMTIFGECSYKETGCGDCAVVEKVRKALKQTDPNSSEKPNNCETCVNGEGDIEACGYCRHGDLYKPKDEPQTERSE